MALDIVEIALDSMSDFSDFEKLATEIMQNEGYPDIIPLGGVADGGKDAVVERFYEQNRRQRIIFQFTMQETIRSKLKSTIQKLENQEYSTLVLVTSRPVSTERRSDLEHLARSEADLTLEIYDRKVISARLSNFDNNLFHRHFPNIEQQLAVLRRREGDHSFSADETLRAALTFVVSDESERARRGILRELVLAAMEHLPPEKQTAAAVAAAFGELLPELEPPPAEQVRSALDWLAARNLVSGDRGHYVLTDKALERSRASDLSATWARVTLASDVADVVAGVADEALRSTVSRALMLTCMQRPWPTVTAREMELLVGLAT